MAKEWPIITDAWKTETGVWTNNPRTEGRMRRSQHPGPQVGVTPDGEPVYGKSGQPGYDPKTGKVGLPKRN